MAWLRNMMCLLAGAVCVIGCRSPLGPDRSGETLQHAVREAVARELAPAADGEQVTAGAEPHVPVVSDDVLNKLAARRDELESLGPLPHGEPAHQRADVGPDLTGAEDAPIRVTLQDAVEAAINRNLSAQASRLQPQITAEQLLSAEAVFDAVLFANMNLNWVDQPQRTPVIMGFPLGTPYSQSENFRFETGVRQRFTPGTEVFVSTDLTRLNNRSTGISFIPDPANTGAIRLGVTQPLLRGFGADATTANVQLARTGRQRSVHQYHADLQTLAAQTESAYWDLDAAWRRLAVAQWLLDEGIKVRDTMDRREFDVRPAEYSDAVARVQQRQADVIRARRAVRVASDALKLLINDPQVPVSAEATLQPLDEPLDPSSPLAFNLREAILAAIQANPDGNGRPEIQQAALEIEDASIRQRYADNQRLPLLNLSAETAFYGLDDSPSGAYGETTDGDFIDYILGVAFEWPIGNRGPEADARAARLQRSAAAISFQRTVQNVVLEVKNALRDVMTNWELIRATRSFRVAQAENLRTLLVEEDLLRGLTPEFLNLKFTRQETLANARLQEVQALTDYNKSLAALNRAMGTGLKMRNITVTVEP